MSMTHEEYSIEQEIRRLEEEKEKLDAYILILTTMQQKANRKQAMLRNKIRELQVSQQSLF